MSINRNTVELGKIIESIRITIVFVADVVFDHIQMQ